MSAEGGTLRTGEPSSQVVDHPPFEIPLECGDPDEKPASFTRFVLPFAYNLVLEKPAPSGGPRYRPLRKIPGRFWREKYLTSETSEVLFGRTGWYELDAGAAFTGWDLDLVARGKPIRVRLKPPWLILFEDRTTTDKGRMRKPFRAPDDPLSTGFLILDLYFPASSSGSPTLDDLLMINERFRFWQRPYAAHYGEKNGYGEMLAHCPVDLLNPDRTVGAGCGDCLSSYLDRWRSFLGPPLEDEAGDLRQLFPQPWEDDARSWAAGDSTEQRPVQSGWIVYADNRTFVWTCAIVQGGGNTLRQAFPPLPPRSSATSAATPRRLRASSFGHWIKLLNVDPPGGSPFETHATRAFERRWADERTYRRWEEWGTFYGFCYHSGAMLAPPLNDPDPPLWKHFREMYFDLALIILYLRVSLFRFSTRLTAISSRARDNAEKGDEQWRKDFQELRRTFMLFTNLYQFPLLSNQQQGVEMYTLARKMMDVDDLFREVQEEIRSSHEYFEVREARDLTETTVLLTAVATVGLAVGLAIGFLGMNLVGVDGAGKLAWPSLPIVKEGGWWAFVALVGLGLLFVSVSVLASGIITWGVRWLASLPGTCRRWLVRFFCAAQNRLGSARARGR